jgi:cytochrome P450
MLDNSPAPTLPELDPSLFVDVDLFGQSIKADPTELFLEWSKKPPFYVMINGRPNAVICRHDQVKWALTDFETISATPRRNWGVEMFDYFNGMRTLLEYDPPEHTAMRKLMQPGFTPRQIALIESGVHALIEKTIDELSSRQGFDMITDYAQPLMYRLLLGEVLGIPEEDWHIFSTMSGALELVATVGPDEPKPAAYMEAFNATYNYCDQLIQQRRSHAPVGDLIDIVIQAHDEAGSISTDDLFSTLIQLLTGGLGTIIATLGLCVIRLCRNPDQMQLLRDDTSLLNSAIEECLRMDSLGNFRHRYVAKDCVVDGTPLYRGMIVHISLGASNYDPDFFPEPEKFDIARNPRDISTFGHSAHFCVGNILARKVLRKSIGEMVKRFPNLRLADPNETIVYGGMPTERFPLSVRLRID